MKNGTPTSSQHSVAHQLGELYFLCHSMCVTTRQGQPAFPCIRTRQRDLLLSQRGTLELSRVRGYARPFTLTCNTSCSAFDYDSYETMEKLHRARICHHLAKRLF